MRNLFLLAALTLSGCIRAGASSAAMGPDQYMVTCGKSATYCDQEAEKLCGGRAYDVSGMVEDPALFASFGRMKMVVKCR